MSRKFILFPLFLFALVGVLLSPNPTLAAPHSEYIVTSEDDTDDAVCNAAHCTLREAINAANAHLGLDRISFDIGGCICIIYPLTSLPAITDPVIIDGFSEDGAAPFDGSNDAVYKVMLRGAHTPGMAFGLEISGGASTVKGLVINEFDGGGIWLHAKGGNTIEGNYIGTFTSGVIASPNGRGILISGGSHQNLIGGQSYATMNVISGNTGAGIELALTLEGGADRNLIRRNLIGMDINLDPLGNSTGILVRTKKNNIGGDSFESANLIAGNTGNGIELAGAGARANVIFFNFLFNPDNPASGNGGYGILLRGGASKNKLGKTNAPNFIGGSGADGIAILDANSQKNSIRGNASFSNGGLGIDLGDDGVTANDAGDGDAGPNRRQNYPVINSASPLTNRVKGKLVAAPNAIYTIDFYSTEFCDATGYGEGIYLDTLKVTTDSSGVAKFIHIVDAPIETNFHVTAIAIDRKGNTSEFGKCKLAR